jgi:hypothetical protein
MRYYAPPASSYLATISLTNTVGLLQVAELPVGTQSVFSFWVGMDFLSQAQILDLCISCKTVHVLAVFQDRKWRNPQEGILEL